MSKVNESLSNTFGLDPLECVNKQLPTVIEQEEVPDNSEKDFEFVRNKLHGLISEGTDAFQFLAELAKSEEKISAFSTLNEMLSNLSDISMKLLEVHEKKQKIKATEAKTSPSGQTNVTNNVAFLGSTADLSKFLQSTNNEIGDTFENETDKEDEE